MVATKASCAAPGTLRFFGAGGQRSTRATDCAAALSGSCGWTKAITETIGSALLRWQSATEWSAGMISKVLCSFRSSHACSTMPQVELAFSHFILILEHLITVKYWTRQPFAVSALTHRLFFGAPLAFLSCSLFWWNPILCPWKERKRWPIGWWVKTALPLLVSFRRLPGTHLLQLRCKFFVPGVALQWLQVYRVCLQTIKSKLKALPPWQAGVWTG